MTKHVSDDPVKAAAQAANLPGNRQSYPPAPPGNTRAAKHFIHSRGQWKQQLENLCEAELYNLIADAAPMRDAKGRLPKPDRLAVAQAAQCMADQVAARLAVAQRGGMFDEKGHTRPEQLALERFRREMMHTHLPALLMTPLARLDAEWMQKLLEVEKAVAEGSTVVGRVITVRTVPPAAPIDVDSVEVSDATSD